MYKITIEPSYGYNEIKKPIILDLEGEANIKLVCDIIKRLDYLEQVINENI